MKSLLLSPVNTFNRLNYLAKFTIVSLLFIVPLAVTLSLLVSQQNTAITAAEAEIRGVAYLRPLNILLNDVLQHRSMMQRYGFGPSEALQAQIMAVQAQIDSDLAAVQAVDEQFGAQFASTELLGEVLTAWQTLRANAFEDSDFQVATAHVGLIDSISNLALQVGNSSQLIVDPELETYYIKDIILLQLPAAQRLAADTILLVERINARRTIESNRPNLEIALNEFLTNTQTLATSLDVAASQTQDSTLEPRLRPLQQQYAVSLNALDAVIRANLVSTFTPNFDDPAFPVASQQVLQDNLALFTAASEVLESLLQQRIGSLRSQQLLTLIFAVGLTVAAFGLGVVIFRAVSQPLALLTDAARRLATGDLNVQAQVVSTDEVGVLANTFNEMTGRLRFTLENLEAQVLERTRTVEQRTAQIATGAEIARTASTELDPVKLLDRAVNLIRNRFELYYVGAFLVDDPGKFAVLRAGTGNAGQEMLANHHQLEIGGRSMIGAAIDEQQARIALDVGQEAVRFSNPYLPLTRSEMALPLVARARTLGALTIQSEQPAAFTPEDVVSLQGMADLIAIALDNAQLFQEAQQALDEVTKLHRSYITQAWSTFAGTDDQLPTYSYANRQFVRGEEVSIPLMDQLENELTPLVSATGEASMVTVPIRLRNQLIGAVAIEAGSPARHWTVEDLALIQAVIEQTALSLENARLLQETERALAEARRLADREQTINLISNKIRRLPSVESVLTTALVELGRTLGASKGLVRLGASTRRAGQLEERRE